MVSVAKTSADLSRRVQRFLERERCIDPKLKLLLLGLSSLPAYLFGGVIRDIAFSGVRKVVGGGSDIDIVYASLGGSAEHQVREVVGDECGRNKFGGYRFFTDRWTVDLWSIQSTWAFKADSIKFASPESILQTTITNWESVLFRLSNGQIICGKHYLEDISNGYLDIVLEENPNELGMYVKVARACASGRVSRLSERAARLLRQAFSEYPPKELCAYEREHYRSRMINEAGVEYLEGVVNRSIGEVIIQCDFKTGRLC